MLTFLYQPVFHVLHRALALEVELDVVEGIADFPEGSLWVEALHLFNRGERYWLVDTEIQTLIEENEPFQKLNDLVEMIGETFRRPKETEKGKW